MSLSSAVSGAGSHTGACRGSCRANRHIVPDEQRNRTNRHNGCVAWQFPAGCLYQITCPCRRTKHRGLVLFGHSSLKDKLVLSVSDALSTSVGGTVVGRNFVVGERGSIADGYYCGVRQMEFYWRRTETEPVKIAPVQRHNVTLFPPARRVSHTAAHRRFYRDTCRYCTLRRKNRTDRHTGRFGQNPDTLRPALVYCE